MKTLIRTMILLVAVPLITAGSVTAGNAADEKSSDAVEIQVKPTLPVGRQAELASVPARSSGYRRGLTLPSISMGRNIMYGSRSGNVSEVLVIPSGEITTEEIAKVTEDMNIMSRIFEKNLQQSQININSMFFSSSDPFQIAFSRNKPPTQGMYLQGYGALFLMKVDFPLSPGPQVEQEQETQQKNEEDVDTVWMEIQREMYEPQESRKEKTERPEKEYDPEKVEDLKTILVKSLKHAANIRSLKPDESVILSVTGSGSRSGVRSMTLDAKTGQVLVIDGKNRARFFGRRVPLKELSLPTNIIIRAKKSDIDRFAGGDLDFDQFRQNTKILTCAYLDNQSGSAGPMIGDYHGFTTSY